MRWITDNGSVAVIQDTDPDGNVTSEHETNIYSATVPLRDQGRIHGIDFSTGAIAMVASDFEQEASVRSFHKGFFTTPCTDGILNADVNPAGQIGLVPSATFYTYDFVDFPPADARSWKTDDKNGVIAAFDKWDQTMLTKSLVTRFRILSQAERNAGTTPDIGLRKANLGVDPSGNVVTGGFNENQILPDNRITSGTIFFTLDKNVLLTRDGYYKVALHEIGHTFGLAHPTATAAHPGGTASFAGVKKGGTVMNPMGNIAGSPKKQEQRDDFLGFVPRTPTLCDTLAVRRAELK
jgi:hypothetical protein